MPHTANTLTSSPLLQLGFRPFFLLGAALAAIAVPIWIGALLGHWSLPLPTGGWLAWHRHEMVFGFVGAIVAGFLLTAVQTWTGRPSVSGTPLGMLLLLWGLARGSWWLPSAVPLLILNTVFWLAVTAVMARLLWVVQQRRNYPIVGVLLLLTAADSLTLSGVWLNQPGWQQHGTLAAVWLVVAMMTLIGGRVIPFFTFRGVGKSEQVAAWPWLDAALLLGTVAVAVSAATGLPSLQWATGCLLFLLGTGHAVRVWRGFDVGVLRVPLLWSLYLAYAWLIVGCWGMALRAFGVNLPEGQALHAITVGAIGGLILAMMARVSLGHTGRALTLPASFVTAFVLLHLATVLRVIGPSIAYTPAIWLATLGWMLAFLQFVIVYGPMLCRARVDGNPG